MTVSHPPRCAKSEAEPLQSGGRARGLERTEAVTCRLAQVGQLGQRAGEPPSQVVPLGLHPALEVGRVTDGEPFQEVTAEELHRRLHLPEGGEVVEPVDVHDDPVALDQTHMVARGLEMVGADSTAQRGQGAPQGAASMHGIGPGPEQVGQPVTGAGPVGDGEEGQDGDGLAGVERDERPVTFDPWRAQQADLDHARHPLS